jgi:hypothetical protein
LVLSSALLDLLPKFPDLRLLDAPTHLISQFQPNEHQQFYANFPQNQEYFKNFRNEAKNAPEISALKQAFLNSIRVARKTWLDLHSDSDPSDEKQHQKEPKKSENQLDPVSNVLSVPHRVSDIKKDEYRLNRAKKPEN